MKQNNNQTGYQAPAVQKAFELLTFVSKSDKGVGISEIANALGFSKGTTSGLIQALVRLKVLNRAQGKKYFLGPALVELSLSAWNYLKLNKVAQPLLEELRDLTGETVFLGAFSHDRSFIIATAEAAKPLKITSPPGTTIPILAGATGKVFLSLLENEECLELLNTHGLTKYAPKSIADKKTFMKEVEKVREQGYALDNEEYIQGVKAIAAGVGNIRGLPVAVWIVGFANAISDEAMGRMIQLIKEFINKFKTLIDNKTPKKTSNQ